MRFSSSIVITALLTLSAARVQIAPEVTPPEIDPGTSLKSTSGQPESLGKTDPSKTFGNDKRTLTSRADRAAESPGGGSHPGHSGKLMRMIRSVSSRSGEEKGGEPSNPSPGKATGGKKDGTGDRSPLRAYTGGVLPVIDKLRRVVEPGNVPSKTIGDKKTKTRSADNGADSPRIGGKLRRVVEPGNVPSKTIGDKKTKTRSADNGANSPKIPIHDKLMRLFRA
ncbi:uncharacterized protein RSE6_09518 [Rhynchosporium secalis]|uniref:Uncharacterized protein n=1 Tax=Rhynchosporium secalis TaxID=38038 RepID=A0A1E1MI32_RHYSE|nr:uncharacterized protein RSE6_09518 [Rhynchosporium secalis]